MCHNWRKYDWSHWTKEVCRSLECEQNLFLYERVLWPSWLNDVCNFVIQGIPLLLPRKLHGCIHKAWLRNWVEWQQSSNYFDNCVTNIQWNNKIWDFVISFVILVYLSTSLFSSRSRQPFGALKGHIIFAAKISKYTGQVDKAPIMPVDPIGIFPFCFGLNLGRNVGYSLFLNCGQTIFCYDFPLIPSQNGRINTSHTPPPLFCSNQKFAKKGERDETYCTRRCSCQVSCFPKAF